MGFLDKTTTKKITKTSTGADYNNPSPVLKDKIHIVTAAEEISKVLYTGFHYTTGIHSLEVYVDGVLKRVKELYDGTWYGDYVETSAYSVTFESAIIVAGSNVRFRVTNNTMDYSNQNSNNLTQIGKDVFGENFRYTNSGVRVARSIGVFTDGDTTPDISNYRTWKSANTATTYITDFDGGLEEDIRHIIFGDSNTVLTSGSGLNLFGGQNFYAAEGDMCFAVNNGTDWDIFCRTTVSDSTSIDILEIVDSTSAASGIVTVPFSYTLGIYHLKVFEIGRASCRERV